MDGKTPEEVEADMMCTDGTCTVRPANNNGTRVAGQHQVAELGSAGTGTATTSSNSISATTAPCHDGSCYDTAVREDAAREELYDLSHGPIFHLCQKENWLDAVRAKKPYFAPTFWSDGRFTRGSCALDSLVETANAYYKSTEGEWLVLEMDPHLVHQMGTMIAVHRAPESTREEPVQCLKIHGGIPTGISGLVTQVYRMQRNEDGTFLSIIKTGDIVPKASSIVITMLPLLSEPSALRESEHNNVPKEEATGKVSKIKDSAVGMKTARTWFRSGKLRKGTKGMQPGS